MADEAQNPKAALRSALRKFMTIALIGGAFLAAAYLGRMRKQNRLENFAQCLTDKKAMMYGLFWCPHCKDQEEMFGAAFEHVTYIECGTLEHKEQERCSKDGIKNFPTWQFADGQRHEGVMSFADLGAKTGCSIQ